MPPRRPKGASAAASAPDTEMEQQQDVDATTTSKRKASTKAKTPAKKAKPEPADPVAKPKKRSIKTLKNQKGRVDVQECASVPDLNLVDLPFTIDESTKNTKRFVDLVHSQGLRIKAGAPSIVYTPSDIREAQYVSELPLHDPDNRLYQLDDSSVELVDHTQPDGTIVKAWSMQAHNKMRPDEEPVQLYTMRRVETGVHKSVLRWSVLTETLCDDISRMIELCKMTVDVMNRAPTSLDIAAWHRKAKTAGETSLKWQQVSVARTFISITSLLKWQEYHAPDCDLGVACETPVTKLWGQPNITLGRNGVRLQGRHSHLLVLDGLDHHIKFEALKRNIDVAAVEANMYSSNWYVLKSFVASKARQILIPPSIHLSPPLITPPVPQVCPILRPRIIFKAHLPRLPFHLFHILVLPCNPQ